MHMEEYGFSIKLEFLDDNQMVGNEIMKDMTEFVWPKHGANYLVFTIQIHGKSIFELVFNQQTANLYDMIIRSPLLSGNNTLERDYFHKVVREETTFERFYQKSIAKIVAGIYEKVQAEENKQENK